eukprot:UC4_evm1s133
MNQLFHVGFDINCPYIKLGDANHAVCTFLGTAVTYKRASLVKFLLEHGARPDGAKSSRSHNISTPLHTAVISGELKIVALLLENFADPLAMDESGKTSLCLACEKLSLEADQETSVYKDIKKLIEEKIKTMIEETIQGDGCTSNFVNNLKFKSDGCNSSFVNNVELGNDYRNDYYETREPCE